MYSDVTVLNSIGAIVGEENDVPPLPFAVNTQLLDAPVESIFAVPTDPDKILDATTALSASEEEDPIVTFSKVVEDAVNATKEFAAVMTCDHADENCPFIPGAEKRFPLRFEDPKAFDDSPLEEKMYSERSHQIGAELFYLFEKVAKPSA